MPELRYNYRWKKGLYLGKYVYAVSAMTGFDGCAYHVRRRGDDAFLSVGFGLDDTEDEVRRCDAREARRREARRSAPQLSLFDEPTDQYDAAT